MILIDYSSIIHRKLYSAIVEMKPKKIDGKYITKDYINYAKYIILSELFEITAEFGNNYGPMVICLDNKSPEGYWRKDYLKSYKSGRSKGRQESDINFPEVWEEINPLTDIIKRALPWRVLEVHRAEADDIILVLSESFPGTDILIHSPDKDMIQAQYKNPKIKQYSALTKRFILPEDKHSNIEEWMLEHVCLGDAADEVPKIVDGTEFSERFIDHLKSYGVTDLEPSSFKNGSDPGGIKREALLSYKTYKTNRKGEETVLDIYKDIRFGPSTMARNIKKFGSLDNFLDSNPMYRENYERNRILVLSEGIPNYIRENIIKEFNKSSTEFLEDEFREYLRENNLESLLLNLPNELTVRREITLEDLMW